jgi:hypothetical protein
MLAICKSTEVHMSVRLGAIALVLVFGLGPIGGLAQSVSDAQFMMIDTTRLGTLQTELAVAGQKGFAVVASGDFSVVLQQDGKGPRTYQVVAPDDSKLLSQQLSSAGADGFRVVRPGVWKLGGRIAVILERQPDGSRFAYDVVDVDDKGAQASGGVRASSVESRVIMERRQDVHEAAAASIEYRKVSASRPGTLENNIVSAAAGGFRVVGAGKMSVVMERNPAVPTPSTEYRVLAVARLPTLRREIQAAAAEGFEIAAIPTRDNEFVAVLERPSGTVRKLDYVVEEVGEKNVDQKLRALAMDGYVIDRISGITTLAFARRPAR